GNLSGSAVNVIKQFRVLMEIASPRGDLGQKFCKAVFDWHDVLLLRAGCDHIAVCARGRNIGSGLQIGTKNNLRTIRKPSETEAGQVELHFPAADQIGHDAPHAGTDTETVAGKAGRDEE